MITEQNYVLGQEHKKQRKEADMFNAQDKERVVKASQTANLLVSDLREMVNADDLLLADVAMEMLGQAVQLEQKLKRIASLAKEKQKASRKAD